MKYLVPALGLFAVLLIVNSCETVQRRTPRSVGGTSEILVVTQNPEQWNGMQGEAIRNFFGQPQYGLPQEEPIFKLANITVDNLSDMFKKHRNLLIVENDPSLNEAVVETRSDLWAKPQRIIKVVAANPQQWVNAFNRNSEGFKILYDRTERERLLNIFRPTTNAALVDDLYNHLGIKMTIPSGFYMAKKEAGFAWIRNEAVDFSQGLIIYSIPYRDTFDLNPLRLVAVRDSILQKHIPGPSDGSFMSTEKEFLSPHIVATNQYITDYAIESRGMWNVIGDFMAGPYVAYTIVDHNKGSLLTVEGYVYAPNKDKRDYLRQMEAILYSLNMNQQKDTPVDTLGN
jgi:hypothetical protein